MIPQKSKISFSKNKRNYYVKKLTIITTALLSTLLLTGCTQSTTSGGEKSLTNYNTDKTYELSTNIMTDIEMSKEKIIITELINSQFHSYEKTALKVSDFIKSANKQMEEHGYTIISSDTNGLGKDGDMIFVTLIFTKNK